MLFLIHSTLSGLSCDSLGVPADFGGSIGFFGGGAGGSTYQNQPSSWRLKNWFFVAGGGAVVCAVVAD
ncbi:hypothetical protein VWR49_22905, partial [Xanthomonas citri pv. citri]